MKKWAEELVDAFQSCDKTKIREIFNCGFPHSAVLHVKNSEGEILISRTYPIHFAAEYGYLDILQELVTAGADINAIDSYQRTPVMVSCGMGHLDIVRYLVEEADANVVGFDYNGNTVLHIASLAGQYHILRYLVEDLQIPINLPNKSKQTALSLCQKTQEKTTGELSWKLERVIGYLASHQNKHTPAFFTPLRPKQHEPVRHSCHSNCISRYNQTLWADSVGIEVQSFHSPKLDRFAFSKFAHNNLNSSRKFSSDIPSVDRMIRNKCNLIYDKYMSSHQLMVSVKEKSSNQSLMPLYRKSSAPSFSGLSTSKSNKTDFLWRTNID
ncbi:unnamed protein product [Blepharisma stoltei]|uniref:Uncharacterized protein n=1 Tax=Blepharisma stoltei TaxID=1481888 RepID=A0AAU9IDP7_9CILI|nr:unnamed protein product [Blepharisma stoltei]